MQLNRTTLFAAVSAGVLALSLGGTAVASGVADRNCDDFGSLAELEAYVAANPGDPSGLDADDDGIACESLYPPGAPISSGGDVTDDDDDDNDDDDDDDMEEAPVANPVATTATMTG